MAVRVSKDAAVMVMSLGMSWCLFTVKAIHRASFQQGRSLGVALLFGNLPGVFP